MNVFSGLTVSSTDRSDVNDKSGDEPRFVLLYNIQEFIYLIIHVYCLYLS